MSETIRPKTIDRTETTTNTYWSKQYQLEIVSEVNPAWGDHPIMKEFNVKNIEFGCEYYAYGLCMDITVRDLMDGQHCNHCLCTDCHQVLSRLPMNNTFKALVASHLKITERMKLPVDCKVDDNDHVFLPKSDGTFPDECLCQTIEMQQLPVGIDGHPEYRTTKRDYDHVRDLRIILRDDFKQSPIS